MMTVFKFFFLRAFFFFKILPGDFFRFQLISSDLPTETSYINPLYEDGDNGDVLI